MKVTTAVKLALSASVMMAGTALADSYLPSSGNGELVLYVQNLDNPSQVYARGLGVRLDDVLTESAITGGGYTGSTKTFNFSLADIAPDQALKDFLGTSPDPTKFKWTIMAGDGIGDSANEGALRYVTTLQGNLTGAGSTTPANSVIISSFSNLESFQGSVNGAIPGSSLGDKGSTSTGGLWENSQAPDPQTWFGGNVNNVNGLGSSAKLYVLANRSDTPTQKSEVWRANGTITLLADGTVSFASATSVPLPAAAWLFMSGLLGFAGVGRRRSGSQA